jgi:8-oxo-dGTP pyrophosphatase MutT (NUDIX family)
MTRRAIRSALKAIPASQGRFSAPNAAGMGRVSPAMWEQYAQNSYMNAYGPFLPRPPELFSDGAFAPAPPIIPTPLDQPPRGGIYAGPRWWEYRQAWNLPTPPGTEGLKLASFDQLRTLAQKYCLSPGTRVLCSDFTWRPLSGISLGDEIIAFDENPPGPRLHRKMRTATVTDYDRISRPSYRVRFTDGREVVASAEHLWLTAGNGGKASREFLGRNCETCGRFFDKGHAYGAHRKGAHGIDGAYDVAWIATDQLRPGSKIKDLGKPWQRDNSWESGYLSGVFDGEASLIVHSGPKGGWEITFPQNPGAVFDATGRFLKEKGYNTRVHGPDKTGCMHLSISGIGDCFRFLGEMQPYRLLKNSARWLDGTRSAAQAGCAIVESVEFLGDQEVIAIGTSTSTLIAEGLFSHNSVARACIELRIEEIRGLEWNVKMTTQAAKAYRNDLGRQKELGELIGKFTKFFRRPDPDFWNFDSFLNAFLEEIFVYDALSVIFRPKFGASFGMGGRGLLGSDLDSLNLVSGPTIRPLIDLHGGRPAPPAPAYQQFLYGVPRSDYMTIALGADVEDSGLLGSEVNAFDADIMLYAPYWAIRESPYGFPPVERALLPIISGLQKQEFQLDYFREGSVPAVYLSPGDNSITPTQIAELQSALNAIAGDPAYHLKVVVLPPGTKVEPQRPIDLSDGFDLLVQTQVTMAFDVQPIEIGLLPNIGGGSGQQAGATASGVKFGMQEARDIKSRKSTKPLLRFICDIFNYVIQDICKQPDLEFEFEGLANDDDKAQIIAQGVDKVQNGISSIDEVREELDLPPWGLQETSEPVVFTAQGPVPFSMAPELIRAAIEGKTSPGQGTNSGQGGKKTSSSSSPKVRRGGQTLPNGSHPAPLAPHREAPTGAHAAASGAVQSPAPRTGGTTSRSSVAGSRKKAVQAELQALARHLRKGRLISTWEPYNIGNRTLAAIAEDIAKGVLIDVAVARAASLEMNLLPDDVVKAELQWPGWERDLGLVGQYKEQISQAFQDAEIKGRALRKDAAAGMMFVSAGTLHGLISDEVRTVFGPVMTSLWSKAWQLGYDSAGQLLGGNLASSKAEAVQDFLGTEGVHWLEQIARTGLGNSDARSEVIARTEVARAISAGAIQAYRDNGVQYKHLLTGDDGCCDDCTAAKEEGEIPLEAVFPGGGLGGPFHPNCRCVPAPSGVELVPPLAHLSKREDPSRLGWLLLRAEDEDGKYRFLLQQRSEGTWGMPGGTLHIGEDPWAGAYRETAEEIGDLPELKCVRTFHHVEDDKQVYLYLCDVPYFQPKMNGSTPEETQGAAWFRKKEIGELDLTPKFREDWDKSIRLKDNVTKSAQNVVTENGEWLQENNPRYGAGMGGSMWPYPQRAYPENNRDGGGQSDGEMGAIDPPFVQNDLSDRYQGVIYPRGSRDEDFPQRRTRNRGPKKLPKPAGDDNPSHSTDPGPGAQGVPGGPLKGMTPVTGSVPARAAKPYSPHSTPPVAPDPADTVQQQTDEGNVTPPEQGENGNG